MKAKDTVMKAEVLTDVITKASKDKNRNKAFELICLEAQAEISFKAGREEQGKITKDWLMQEARRHKSTVLGDACERIFDHLCRHKDISIDTTTSN